VLNLQFDLACFQRGEASANIGVRKNIVSHASVDTTNGSPEKNIFNSVFVAACPVQKLAVVDRVTSNKQPMDSDAQLAAQLYEH